MLLLCQSFFTNITNVPHFNDVETLTYVIALGQHKIYSIMTQYYARKQ